MRFKLTIEAARAHVMGRPPTEVAKLGWFASDDSYSTFDGSEGQMEAVLLCLNALNQIILHRNLTIRAYGEDFLSLVKEFNL